MHLGRPSKTCGFGDSDSAWEEWSRTHAEEANLIACRAYWIEAHRAQMPGQGNSFLDAWSELRDTETPEVDEHEVAKFTTHHLTRSLVRDLGMSYLAPEEMPTHSQLVELMTLTPIGGYDEDSEAVKTGDRLSVWKASGPYGRLFDGVTTVRLDEDVTHFELGLIPDAIEELRAAAHFLVLNVARQQVIKRARSQRKLIIFEEGARMIQLPGGAKALKEFYAQMRKYDRCLPAIKCAAVGRSDLEGGCVRQHEAFCRVRSAESESR
jgi:hypothetical protein